MGEYRLEIMLYAVQQVVVFVEERGVANDLVDLPAVVLRKSQKTKFVVQDKPHLVTLRSKRNVRRMVRTMKV